MCTRYNIRQAVPIFQHAQRSRFSERFLHQRACARALGQMNCGRDIGPDSLADSRDNGQSGVTYARSDWKHFETLRTFSCDAMLRL